MRKNSETFNSRNEVFALDIYVSGEHMIEVHKKRRSLEALHSYAIEVEIHCDRLCVRKRVVRDEPGDMTAK